MIILIDVGNSRIKLCHYMQGTGELSPVMHLQESEALAHIVSQSPEAVLVSAVSNDDFCEQLSQKCATQKIEYQRLTTADCLTRVAVGYDNPEQLGVDRWMAILGAEQIATGKNLLIIDAGTATTVDLLSADRKHLGGWITPGIEMMISALYKNTAQVVGDFRKPQNISFATNTTDNVNQGCWAMTAALVDFAKVKATELDIGIDKVIVTGGNGKALCRFLSNDVDFQEELIFIGMSRFRVNS